MEQTSNVGTTALSGKHASPGGGGGGGGGADHALHRHQHQVRSAFLGPGFAREKSLAFASELYPKEGRNPFVRDDFPGDKPVNYAYEKEMGEGVSRSGRDAEEGDVEAGGFPARRGRDGAGGEGEGDERSGKKAKRGGWWHGEEGARAAEEDGGGGAKEMEAAGGERKGGGGDAVNSFVVGSVGGGGVFQGVGVSARDLNAGEGVGGAAVAGVIDDGCGDAATAAAVGVGGVVLVGVRGGSGGGRGAAEGGEAAEEGEAVPVAVIAGGGGGGSSIAAVAGVGGEGDFGEEGDGEARDGEGREKGDKDAIGKKKRAELWQDAEMDALVGAYRQIHMKLTVAGKKGKHVFKSANEKWKEVRNSLLSLGVDRQPKEIERKWSNLSTAFKQIADWNKKAGRPSYWDLDEFLKKEKTKAKELPATFRVQLYEAMAEFLGDRTAARRNRGWTQCDGGDRAAAAAAGAMASAGNGVSGANECASGVVDIALPVDKLAPRQPSLDHKRTPVVLVATGSYNPPTYMHLRMFELARDALVDEGYDVLGGYMSPVHDGYGKKGLAPADHRITLCQLATVDSTFIMVDPWEAKQLTYQRTLSVLRRVDRAINPRGFVHEDKVQVMFLCGGDLLESLTTPGVWVPDQLQALFHDHGVICITREEKDVQKLIFESDLLYENRRSIVVVHGHITNDISSTRVRRNLARGLSVKYLTADSVIHHIKTHNLYGPRQM